MLIKIKWFLMGGASDWRIFRPSSNKSKCQIKKTKALLGIEEKIHITKFFTLGPKKRILVFKAVFFK